MRTHTLSHEQGMSEGQGMAVAFVVATELGGTASSQ